MNENKGFIVPLLLVIIALLVIGGGVYIYQNKKAEAPAVVDTETQQGDQVQQTQTPPVVTQPSNQEIINNLVTSWKIIGPSILPGFPSPTLAFYGYPDIIQFIGNNRIIISYQNDSNPLFAVLNYNSSQKQFSYLDGLRASPFKVSETLWNTWRSKYGNISFTQQTYQFSSTRTGDVVYSSDWKLIAKNPFVSDKSSTDVPLDMTNQYAKTYKTLFTAEFAKPANLDGHFRVVAVGCGSNCMYLYALDKNNGKVYRVSAEAFDDYSILDNQIRATLDNGEKVLYIFNSLKDEFQVQYVG